MSAVALRVDSISKKFRLGRAEGSYKTLRETLTAGVLASFRGAGKILKGQAAEKTSGHENTIWALKDVCFEVKSGEIIGIIGRNGAGKTTLLKILSRITEPTEGFAEIHGRVGSLLEVGTGFHAELTGRENIYLSGAILGMKKEKIKRIFDEIVAFAEVEKFVDTPVKHYSSGMYLRLAFAVAAHLDPEVLIVDEVLAVGDAAFQKKCMKKMEDVGQKGRTVLFVSHNMPSITRLCTRAIMLERGILKADGPSDQIVGSYLNSERTNSAAREWPDSAIAPGNDIARLRAVRVRAENGEIINTVNISERFAIEMEYEVLQSGHCLMPRHHFFNEEDINIFDAHDTDAAWMGRKRPAGCYKSTVWIYGNLLSEGMIYVSSGLIGLNQVGRLFYEKNAVAFQVVDTDGKSPARGEWIGKMNGVVRPLFEWDTQFNKI